LLRRYWNHYCEVPYLDHSIAGALAAYPDRAATCRTTERAAMKRNVFKMKLKPGFEAEYKKRHDEIWPELKAEISKAGVRDYSIYLDEQTLTLFAVQKLTGRNRAGGLPDSGVVRKWWAYMADIMETNPDNSPVEVGLKEVFHMD